ncbi:fructose-specific PTS transporter subunit EIIC [Photobacterium lutimaris]|uniref:PTS fructose transporter subunit IIB n=1 Tax=Photobacterium lutimaris TaxID=388278 RepID=A0A2T3IZ18_9GAMM|nr:fructose-specific PTS transporter subunit EIIC [Photobacterium lutimaris]PSU33884.1 PTS fructose transporter subunit IIB [Photobacterium lutimaris]TDR76208.1 PTS system mannose-specific IIC component [Photobacterium lutimaris]
MTINVVAVTGCAAGIAHTYMAARALEDAGKEHGFNIKVETNGSIGPENVLTEEEIANADVVVLASDVEVEKARFAGKKIYVTRPKVAMKDAKALVDIAMKEGTVFGGKGTEVGNITLGKTSENGFIQHVMSGISYMVPMVISAGLLLAIANVFAFQRDDLGRLVAWGFDQSTFMGDLMFHLFKVGQVGFLLMIPLFAGFVANSIASKPAIAPAMIGAYIANDAGFLGTDTGGGFLSAILVAFLVGYMVKYLKMVPWPKICKPLLPIMIIPLIATFLITVIVKYMIGTPIAAGMSSLYEWLTWMTTTYASSTFIIGAIIGAMIGFDFGGPVNKTALIFGTAVWTDTVAKYGIEGANFVPGTAAQAAISVAPLGIFLASKLFKNKFTATEKVSADSAFGMGIVGVTEGAIPFAAAHPVQMITASVAGSALAGGLVGFFDVKFYGGIGSPLGTFVGYIEQPIPFVTWILCTMSGITLTALIIGLWRKPVTSDNGASTTVSDLGDVASKEVFKPEHVLLDTTSKSKAEAIAFIAKEAHKLGYVSSEKQYAKGLKARENQSSTGFKDGMAIPHCKTKAAKNAGVFVVRFSHPIEWETMDDEPVRTAVALSIPAEGDEKSVEILTKLTRCMMNDQFRETLNQKDSKEVDLTISAAIA